MRHKDSMGNVENIAEGGVQFTSAGTGITHSEYNALQDKQLHFIQIWVSQPLARTQMDSHTHSLPHFFSSLSQTY